MTVSSKAVPKHLPIKEPMCVSAMRVDCSMRKTCWRHTTHTPLRFQGVRQLEEYIGGKHCIGYMREPDQ